MQMEVADDLGVHKEEHTTTNSIAEVAFWMIKHRAMAMKITANIPKNIQFILHREVFETSSKLDWLTPMA